MMIPGLLLLSVVVIGLYHQTAHRVLAAIFSAPHVALIGARDRMTARAASLRQRVDATREASGGGTLFGAAITTLIWTILAVADAELAAVTFGPVLGWDLGTLERRLGVPAGAIETYAMPALLLTTLATALFAPWFASELTRPRLLATRGLGRGERIAYRGAALVALFATAGSLLVSSLYRVEVYTSAQPATSAVSAMPEGVVDEVAALIEAPSEDVAPVTPASGIERAMYEWLFIGLAVSTFLLVMVTWHYGPVALSIELWLLLLTLTATAARLAGAAAVVANGLLGWLYEFAHPAMELCQKGTITLTRPAISYVRALNRRESALGQGARPWMIALTSWTDDLEVTDAPAGPGSLHEGVAPAKAAASPVQESPDTRTPEQGVEFEEPVVSQQHAWEAYPGRNAEATANANVNANADEGLSR
ncbi:MAG: hypothetical protein ABS52_07760 [Gemmatimonadetes bacterium SCN 70-22]|nr:MAG: hypothetical protein ABS52_07760 [Gemmatimonadetes bacterium SCN 70-22]